MTTVYRKSIINFIEEKEFDQLDLIGLKIISRLPSRAVYKIMEEIFLNNVRPRDFIPILNSDTTYRDFNNSLLESFIENTTHRQNKQQLSINTFDMDGSNRLRISNYFIKSKLEDCIKNSVESNDNILYFPVQDNAKWELPVEYEKQLHSLIEKEIVSINLIGRTSLDKTKQLNNFIEGNKNE